MLPGIIPKGTLQHTHTSEDFSERYPTKRLTVKPYSSPLGSPQQLSFPHTSKTYIKLLIFPLERSPSPYIAGTTTGPFIAN